MKISPVYLRAEFQAQIEPPPITVINKEPKEVNKYYIIKIIMHQKISNAASETYKLKIITFENG